MPNKFPNHNTTKVTELMRSEVFCISIAVKLSKSVIKHFKSKRPTKVEHNGGFSGVLFAFYFLYITP